MSQVSFADGVVPPQTHPGGNAVNSGNDPIKQCIVYAYEGNTPVAGFYSYGHENIKTCNNSLIECSKTYSVCQVVYFGEPQGDE
jgi:hypothetical protein